QADAFACLDGRAFADERHDAPGDEARNLHDADPAAVGKLDRHRLPLVVLAGLVQLRVDEPPRHVDGSHDASLDRAPVHVNVEDVHEYRYTYARARTQVEFARRHDVDDRTDASVGRAQDESVAQRHHPFGVAEE